MEHNSADIPDYTPPSETVRWYHNGWFSRSFVIIAALFFLMPFINVSCSGTRLATIKGIDLVTGSEIKQEAAKEENSDTDTTWAGDDAAPDRFNLGGDFFEKGDQRNIAPNLLGIMSFASAILALIFSFFNKRVPVLISGGFALLSALCLFFIQVQVNNEVEAKLGPFNFAPIIFEFTPYYWMSLLLLALAAVFAFVRSSVLVRS